MSDLWVSMNVESELAKSAAERKDKSESCTHLAKFLYSGGELLLLMKREWMTIEEWEKIRDLQRNYPDYVKKYKELCG